MTEINNTRVPSSLTLEAQAQAQKQENEMQADAIKAAVRSRSVAPVGDVKVSDTTSSLAVEISLPAPSAPSVDVTPESISGAQSMAGQLSYMGEGTGDTDLLLAKFLKLQVLTETEDLWSQVLAREAQSLLMRGALAQGKQSMLREAEAAWARAESLQNQALAIAREYELGDDGRLDGFFGGPRTFENPAISYSNETVTASANASEDLKAAVDASGEAEGAEHRGESDLAAEKRAEADAALARYVADPSRQGDVAEIDGKRYDIGTMGAGPLMQIVALLAAADFANQRGNDLHASYSQGVGASQMRKGQNLVDSWKRLEGHDEFLDAVNQSVRGTESADKKMKALRHVDEQRLTVAALLEEGAAFSETYARNKLQPVQG